MTDLEDAIAERAAIMEAEGVPRWMAQHEAARAAGVRVAWSDDWREPVRVETPGHKQES